MKWIIGIVSALGISVLSVGLALSFGGSDSSIAGHDENVSVSASNGLSTAISVHGDWSIDVINPDGTLAAHMEINNDLLPSGKEVLTDLLTGRVTLGGWRLSIGNSTGNGNFTAPDLIIEDDDLAVMTTLPATTVRGLEVKDEGTSISMSASYTVVSEGTINEVSTQVSQCGLAFFDRCYNTDMSLFSGHAIPVTDVSVDQKVNISVVYTFGN